MKKYDFVLYETFYGLEMGLFKNLAYNHNSIFVFHEFNFFEKHFSKKKYFKKYRVWTLGNITRGLQVNPHYFGNLKIKEKKNIKTTFFLTSTVRRNYKALIKSVHRLQKEKFNFQVVVTGRSSTFNSSSISKNINNKFIFKYNASYSELYKLVNSSDYIIILLDPNIETDKLFKTKKVSGSYQLSLGFAKPCLINNEYAKFYGFNNENSLIYINSNLYSAMKKAIIIKDKKYKEIQRNLIIKKNELYNISINNIRKVINNINKK